MNTKAITKLLAVAAVSAMTFTSSALTITGSDEILGTVIPGTPAGDANSVEQVRFLVNFHNFGNPNSNLAGSTDNNPDDPGNEIYTLMTQYGSDLPTIAADKTTLDAKVDNNGALNISQNYTYVLGKYGNDTVIWYIGDILNQGSSIILPANVAGTQGSLSHTSALIPQGTRVPDGGATAALLGLGVLGLAAVRRKS